MTSQNETPQDFLNWPLVMNRLMVDYTQKAQAITWDHGKALAQLHRQSVRQVYEQFNPLLPGEAKLWALQRQIIEKGFQIADSWAQVWQ